MRKKLPLPFFLLFLSSLKFFSHLSGTEVWVGPSTRHTGNSGLSNQSFQCLRGQGLALCSLLCLPCGAVAWQLWGATGASSREPELSIFHETQSIQQGWVAACVSPGNEGSSSIWLLQDSGHHSWQYWSISDDYCHPPTGQTKTQSRGEEEGLLSLFPKAHFSSTPLSL